MTMKRMLYNYISVSRYCVQSLQTGEVVKKTKIFSRQGLVKYSKVTSDSNSLHLDLEDAMFYGFKDIPVPGMLVASLFPNIIYSRFWVEAYTSQTLHFRLPVYVDEEIIGNVEAMSIRSEARRRYIVKFKTRCYNKAGALVLDGEAMTVLRSLDINWLD